MEYRINYQLERHLWGEPDEDQLDMWWVTLEVPAISEHDGQWDTVAEALLYGMHPWRQRALGVAPFDVVDAHSDDTVGYFTSVFNLDGEFHDDVYEQFEWVPTSALFLDTVRVPTHLRRRGLGSLLAADALLTLTADGTALFAHPGPTEITDSADERFRRNTGNTRWLAHLGFVPFRDQLWSLDLCSMSACQALSKLRRPVEL